MIAPSDFESRLGFDQLRQRLERGCFGPLGMARVTAMHFVTDLAALRPLLEETNAIKGLRERGLSLPLGAYEDPIPMMRIASIEGNFLETEQFLQLANLLEIVSQCNTWLRQPGQEHASLISHTFDKPPAEFLLVAIRRIIDPEGKVKDNASGELASIRKRIREEERKLRVIADQLMKQALENGWAPSGSQPTIRDGRLVIPVAAEHKRRMKGYVVDQSATGQTVFIEPGAVLEANNDLRDLELEERKEVVRLLRMLTDAVRSSQQDLMPGFDFLGWLDFTHTKARLADDLQSSLPVVAAEPALEWRQARHPLLFLNLKGKRPLVPLDISLEKEHRFLLVSGPNAGGKSVCLKTTGLLQYMLQCGLLVPIHPDSQMGIFADIFLDIGDQQSIENDLSTYSSHLRNLQQFLRHAGERALILLDELGAGTDPNFGGGIAQAVLDELIRKGGWGVATTHYYNLKVFASRTPGIRNASMQFDADKLVPLFKLEIGTPGSSFALEIARKTGLPSATLEAAERIIGKDLTGLERLMKQVAEEKRQLEERRSQVHKDQEILRETMERYEKLSDEMERRKKDILNRARSEASALLQETNREIEKTIRHIRENKAERKETKKVREGLKALGNKVKPEPGAKPVVQAPIEVGDKVRLIGGEVTGTVLSMKGKSAMVSFGSLRSTVSVEQLVHSDQAPVSQPAVRSHGVALHERQSNFTSVLDVRGMRVEELVPVLQHFIDDAILLGQPEVKIIHGKGEGVLRKVVREYLQQQRGVSGFRDEHADRGGEGITYVTFR